MSKSILICLFLIFAQHISAQDSLFVDSRDGRSYPIVEIGDLLWFGTNLAFETPTSWCVEHDKVEHCADGNYYYNTGFDSLCPQGWRVATWADWDYSLKRIVQRHGMSPDSIVYDTVDFGSWSRVLVSGFNLIDDTVSLNIKETGYEEGKKGKAKKKIKYSSASFWVVDKETNDPKMHLHIATSGLNKHNHGSSIVSGKPKNMRRFAVRCVADKK